MSQQLPAYPNLDHLKKQAKDVLRVFRRQKPRWKLADAQRAIARGYGFSNWPSLKTHVEKIRNEQQPTSPTSPDAPTSDDSLVAKTSPKDPVSNSENCSIHPIVGAWIADRQPLNEDIVVEFQLSAEEIKLTQIATDTTGHGIAIRTTICADGLEHPVPFGDDVRLKALWTTSLTLEATFTTSEQTVSRWSYEVSADGKSLVVSTEQERIVFRRL
jgi:hypothetical protein